jgi:hypothetical protein
MARKDAAFPVSRRGAILGALAGLWPLSSRASGEIVPLPLQVKLCAKVVKYDKNFARRVRDRVRVGVLLDEGNADSRYAASTLRREFDDTREIAGVPISVEFIAYSDASAVRAAVDSRRLGLLYLTPGFSERAAGIAGALAGTDLISVSALASDVPSGIVLGFDLVSSQPKLWVNLSSAQQQNVMFEPQALKLMKVFR